MMKQDLARNYTIKTSFREKNIRPRNSNITLRTANMCEILCKIY